MSEHLHPWSLHICLALASIVVVTNLVAFSRALKMKGTLENSLMFLICIDPITSVLCGTVFSVIVIIRYLGIFNSNTCDLSYFSLHTPALVGVVSNALVAVIRYVKIKGHTHLSESLLLKINVIIFILVFSAALSNVVVHKYLGLPVAIISEACLHGRNGRDTFLPAKMWSILNLLIFQIVSITFDIKILQHIRLHNSNKNIAGSKTEDQDKKEEDKTFIKRSKTIHRKVLEIFNDTSSYMVVPVRATILSSLLLVPYMGAVPAMAMLFSSNISITAMYLVVFVLVVSAVRFPCSLFATFTELSTMQHRAQQKTKAERQRAEIEYAMQQRNLNLPKTYSTDSNSII